MISTANRPTSPELLQAVHEHLDSPASGDERSAYLARLARNVIAIVQRELRLGEVTRQVETRAYTVLGVVDGDELATRIRDGHFDGREAELIETLGPVVAPQLGIDNPSSSTPLHTERNT